MLPRGLSQLVKKHFRFKRKSSVMDGGEGSAPQPGGLPALLLQVFVAVWEVGLLLVQKAAAHLTSLGEMVNVVRG